MNLYSTLRPTSSTGKKTWIRGHIVISNIQIFPQPDGNIELSIFLPIKDDVFTSSRFSKIISLDELVPFIHSFILDPESTCEEHFTSETDALTPELRTSHPITHSDEVKPKLIEKLKKHASFNIEI